MCWESAPTTGHYHLHVDVVYLANHSRKQVMATFGPADCRTAKATPAQRLAYICKSGHMAVTYNEDYYRPRGADNRPSRRGIDWDTVYNNVAAVQSYAELWRRFGMPTSSEYCYHTSSALRGRANYLRELFTMRSPAKAAIHYTLKKWQRQVVNAFIGAPSTSKRKVLNVWSSESGTGKSSLVDIIRNELNKNVFVWPVGGEAKSGIFMYHQEPVVVFDLTRNTVMNNEIYEAIEMVSDQRLVSTGKYEGKTVRFDAHTLVLSNRPLEEDSLPGRLTYINPKPLDEEEQEELDISLSLDFMD